MLGFFFNMAPLNAIHLQTILEFLNQVLRILVKNVGSAVTAILGEGSNGKLLMGKCSRLVEYVGRVAISTPMKLLVWQRRPFTFLICGGGGKERVW